MSTILQSNPAAPANIEPPVVRWHFPPWLIAALLAAVTFALYWPALQDEFVNFDDGEYITDNVRVQQGLTLENVGWAFTTGKAANWHPLTWLSLMLDVTLFGKSPAGPHFTNVLLHVLDAVLLFWLLRILTGATWRSAGVASLFAWHPVHVESVAWAVERKDVLSAFFGFLALIFYARYAQRSTVRNGFYRSPDYWLAWGCLALGLMSKPMLVTWPFVLLLLDYWPLARWLARRLGPLLWEKVPFFALTVVTSIVTFLVQRHAGAVASTVYLPVAVRGENAVISYARYVGKIFWPANLAVFYPRPAHWPLADVMLAGILLIGLSVLVWRTRPRYPFLLTGWLWFCGTLVPVIGLIQVGQQAMADRYAYLPSVGIFIMVVWGAGELAKPWPRAVLPLSAIILTVAIFCLAVTRQQLTYWRNTEALFRHALAVTRDNYLAHCILGTALKKDGRLDEAVSHFQEAIRIRPTDPTVFNDMAGVMEQKGQTNEAVRAFHEAIRLNPDFVDAHFDLANFLLEHGQPEAAIAEFRVDLRLKPDDADACYDLGKALLDQGQADAAISEFQAAFHLKEYDAGVHYNLGNLLAKKGQTDAAMAQFQETIRLKPDNADAHNNLGNLLAKTGQTGAAITELQAALRLQPENADTHYNLGYAYLKTGGWAEAISQFQAAIRLKPNYAPAHYNLAVALNKQGQADLAISQFEEAIRLAPDYAIAHNSLGVALTAQGKLDEAIQQFQTALQIKPDYANAQNNLTRALALKNQPPGAASGAVPP